MSRKYLDVTPSTKDEDAELRRLWVLADQIQFAVREFAEAKNIVRRSEMLGRLRELAPVLVRVSKEMKP